MSSLNKSYLQDYFTQSVATSSPPSFSPPSPSSISSAILPSEHSLFFSAGLHCHNFQPPQQKQSVLRPDSGIPSVFSSTSLFSNPEVKCDQLTRGTKEVSSTHLPPITRTAYLAVFEEQVLNRAYPALWFDVIYDLEITRQALKEEQRNFHFFNF
ncbi:unnamed protein product [Protopolystoma xenopodis]|uniref:Uncharacterized protein n=1 Tax=Protopolystoma xenopodis TaxID=117903 RepID=A0A3S5CV89_9PLAT|nr:unnamed protein product [Protopolystoma xenopodis]